jgi:hypothetical protein
MSNFFSSAIDKLDDLKDDVKEKFDEEIGDSISSFGLEKLNDIWDTINESSETLLEVGYTITDIILSVQLPPTLAISFTRVDNVSEEQEKAILEANKDKKVLSLILKALSKANHFEKQLKSGVYAFIGLQIKIGASLPSIDMKFKKHIKPH